MPDHPELVSKKKYTDDFIAAILYCYSYGFFFDDENGKKSIGNTEFNVQKSRIKKILVNYVDWDNLRMINKPSEAMKDNPFQRFYRFCRHTPVYSPSYFLHVIAGLSWEFELKDREILYYNEYLTDIAEDLGITDKRDFIYYCSILKNKNAFETAKSKTGELLKSDPKGKKALFEALKKHFLAAFLTDNYIFGVNKTTMNHLKGISETQVIIGKNRPRNETRDLDRTFYYWCLDDLTMEQFIEAGRKSNESFESHLHQTLDFFSRYYPFGEIGMYLLDRMGAENNSPFRFRHEYFMQTLCDFHVIDLLNAIDEKKWCLIDYHHATAEFDTKLLCYPLQVRVGSRNGREHLMYYYPIKHCYTSLRIEFIKKITYYPFDKVEKVLLQSGVVQDKVALAREILNSKAGINYLWGVTTPSLPEGRQENNARVSITPKHVTMLIRYDSDKEYYIRNRLYKECRHGIVTEMPKKGLIQFDIDVAAPNELTPWVRSFYTRIVRLEGLNTDKYTLETDLIKMQKILGDGKLDSEVSSCSHKIWSVPQDILDRLGKGEEATGHNLIFNEIFSIYYYIIADTFVKLMLKSNGCSEEDLSHIIFVTKNESIKKYNNKVGKGTDGKNLKNEMTEIFEENGFFIKKQMNEKSMCFPVYKIDRQLNFYKEVLPLSIMEKRWLKTIITDPKIYLFLSENEVNHLRDFFETDSSSTKPLPMDDIVCYDRYHVIGRKTKEGRVLSEKEINENYRHIISTILEGISSQVSLNITYLDNQRKIIKGEFDPVVIEYSKRNNHFQGYFLPHGQSDGAFMIFNFPQIIEISVAGSTFRHSEAEKKYDKYIESSIAMVEFEFIDERNLADRILTELSPWKRECIKNGNHYRINLYYRRGKGDDRGEELDIVIRLMSFGGYLKFKDMDKGSIGHQIKERVDNQLELIREKDKINDDGETR